MKIKIITTHNSINFGAALQAYALSTFLSNMGNEVENIDFRKEEIKDYKLRIKIRRSIIKILSILRNNNETKEKFYTFIHKYLKLTKEYSGLEELRDDPPEADIYICGSDQIWNCAYLLREYFFLDFGNAKKISYAASIGLDYIPQKFKNRFIELICNLDAVSVREEQAKKIIEGMCNIRCEVSLDPTFLLTSNEWSTIINKRIIADKYILYYALHRSKTSNKILKRLKKKYGYKIVTIATSPLPVIGDIVIRNAGPLEFLNLYKYTEFAINASFHGTVFSMIFEKPFYSMLYGPGKSRVKTLLENVGLSNRIYEEKRLPMDLTEKIDFKKVKKKLAPQIEKSKEYLYRNLRG